MANMKIISFVDGEITKARAATMHDLEQALLTFRQELNGLQIFVRVLEARIDDLQIPRERVN